MSLSKRSAYLLLQVSPSLLKMATITVLAITLAQIFEKTEPGKRWKEWLAHLSEQPTKLEQWEDDYIMKRLKDHQCYFSDLDFHTESQSSTENGSTTSEPSPSNSQEINASSYNIKVSLQRSVSLPNISYKPARDDKKHKLKKMQNKAALERTKTCSNIQPYTISDEPQTQSSPYALVEPKTDSTTNNSISDISMLQLSYIESQNPWTIIDRKTL